MYTVVIPYTHRHWLKSISHCSNMNENVSACFSCSFLCSSMKLIRLILSVYGRTYGGRGHVLAILILRFIVQKWKHLESAREHVCWQIMVQCTLNSIERKKTLHIFEGSCVAWVLSQNIGVTLLLMWTTSKIYRKMPPNGTIKLSFSDKRILKMHMNSSLIDCFGL